MTRRRPRVLSARSGRVGAAAIIACAVGCSGAPKPVPDEGTPSAEAAEQDVFHPAPKPGAPVDIQISLTGTVGDVRVVLGADATEFQVRVRGLRGADLTAPAALREERVALGDRASLEFALSTPADVGVISVEVRGRFNGEVLGRAQTLTLGGSPEGRRSKLDAQGRRIKALPAGSP